MAYIIPYTLFTQGIYTGLLNTISSLTVGICHLISSIIYTHNTLNVDNTIAELDIERKLNVIISVIKAISSIKAYMINDIKNLKSIDDPIQLCLKYLNNIIHTIYKDIFEIKQKIERHQHKWFTNWRTINIDPLVNKLKNHTKILDLRFEELKDIYLFMQKITL